MFFRSKKILILVSLLLPLPAICQPTEKIYLSGTGPTDAKQWQFFCTAGMSANKWTTIAVPSCWEQQGFGKYDYGFSKDSVKGKEQGLYKYEFNASPSWKDKKINIVFEGVMTDANVKVNGLTAGAIHQGAFYAFKYDISKLLRYGTKNLLEVTVSKHSANQSVNEAERKADFWLFGGIFRPVYLEVLPLSHIENISINAKADGNFNAVFAVSGLADKATVQIFSADGKLFGEATGFDYSDSWIHYYFDKKFKKPKLWTPESPDLYKAVFTIYNKGKLLHTVTQKFGFRTIEIKQRDGIYVNAVKVKMKGVNRSPFRPETGRTLSVANSLEDVLLIKDMNMNAVRCSHYPPDEHFLDACDSLGVFVIDELAGWHGHYDTPTGTKLVAEMIAHDVNHPSIIMWANGNEGGHNVDLDTLFSDFDIQNRPVIHPWQLFNGIETQHYREYNYGIGNYENGREIVMPTEFLHGQFDGGHGAGLEDYWEKMWHNPLSAGGFLWDLVDQGIMRKDKNDSLDTDKFHAADGIVGPHHEREASYYAIKEIWSPVYFEKKEITPLFDGILNVENRFHFTNFNQCSFKWMLISLGQNSDTLQGKIVAPNINAGEKGKLHLLLPKVWRYIFDVLYVTATDKYGREIFTWSFPLGKPADGVAANEIKEDRSFPTPVLNKDTDSTTKVSVGNISYVFNIKNGLLQQVSKENDPRTFFLTKGPVLCEGSAQPDSVAFDINENNSVVITCRYNKKSLIQSLVWTIDQLGILKMDIHYFPAAYFTNMVGISFSFPESKMKAVEYMGNGPYRVWKNRMKGNRFGIWHKDYNNTETGESWNYPEFKGYYSNMHWCKFIAQNNSFTVYTENEDLFFRLFTPTWKTDQWHNYEPIFPSGDISFMQGISSIGTKTQRNETTGPMGMKNIFYDYEKDPSRALKMVLYFDFNK